MKWLLLRRTSQLTVLGFFLLGPLAGLWWINGSLSGSAILNILPLTDPLVLVQTIVAGHKPAATALTGMALVVFFYLFVGGRAFCSWVCPVNMVADAAAWLRDKTGRRPGLQFPVFTRYLLLAMVLTVALISGTAAWELINPMAIFGRSIIFLNATGALIVGLVIFLFDFGVSRHGWCRICPTGAVYSLIGYLSLLKVQARGRERCDNCMACYSVCPEPQVLTRPLQSDQAHSPVITSGQCTNCGRCIDVCPQDVFVFGRRF